MRVSLGYRRVIHGSDQVRARHAGRCRFCIVALVVLLDDLVHVFIHGMQKQTGAKSAFLAATTTAWQIQRIGRIL